MRVPKSVQVKILKNDGKTEFEELQPDSLQTQS